MECLDINRAIFSLIGSSLIVAGQLLMMQRGQFVRGYGSFCFAFGFLVLGLAAAERDITNFDITHRRVMIGVGSAAAIVAGTFLMYYHLQEKLQQLLISNIPIPYVKNALNTSIPLLDNILIYGGYIGIVYAAALNYDGSINYMKGSLVIGSIFLINYCQRQLVASFISGDSLKKVQIAYSLSWILLIMALGYNC